MPRPCKKKCVSSIPSYTAFIHTDEPIPASHIQMSVEEYETIRLIDYLQSRCRPAEAAYNPCIMRQDASFPAFSWKAVQW